MKKLKRLIAILATISSGIITGRYMATGELDFTFLCIALFALSFCCYLQDN